MLANETSAYIMADASLTAHALAPDAKSVREDLAFGFLTSADALVTRVGLLRWWWLPGSVGCAYLDESLLPTELSEHLPPGLDTCYTPESFRAKPWYVKYSRERRGAVMPLLLAAKFPDRKWYLCGHDDTVRSL